MLKKLAALILLVGLCLPYGCDIRPILGAWDDVPTMLFLGIPVVATVIYALHSVVPMLAGFHERHSRLLHRIFRVVYFGLIGGYMAFAVTGREGWPGKLETAAALIVTGVLFVWQQNRGTTAARLPLLLLTAVGVPEVAYLIVFLKDGPLQVGGWVFTAGWLLGVIAEARVLAVAPRMPHGG
jgi:hypothetical protein